MKTLAITLVIIACLVAPVGATTPRVVHTAIILDCSGSMEDMRREAIDAFNEQVSTLAGHESENIRTITLAKFSTVPHPIDLFAEDVDTLSPLTMDSYDPDGFTAMLDAVGATTEKMERDIYDIGKKYVSVLVIIISDGIENYSKKYDYPLIAERITRLQDTGRWTFVYIGANQDLSEVAERMNIPDGNLLLYDDTLEGWHSLNTSASSAIGMFLHDVDSGATSTTDFFDQGEEE